MARQLGNIGSWDIPVRSRVVVVTKGESLFIARSLRLLRNDIKEEIRMHGDDDEGGSDAQVRVLDKIIPKFEYEEVSDGKCIK